MEKKKLALAAAALTTFASSSAFAQGAGAADRIQTPFILGMALIESLALFAFAVAVMLWLKLP